MKHKNQLYIILPLILIAFGCIKNETENNRAKMLKETLSGEWARIYDKKDSLEHGGIPFCFFDPFGMNFTEDSIDFYLGFIKKVHDTMSFYPYEAYLGNFVSYQTSNDTIYIKDIETNKWIYRWKFIKRNADTLFLMRADSGISIFKKRMYNLDTLPDFDQIVFSSSGCYGTCPIIDVSIEKTGKVMVNGEGYVNRLGLYKGILSEKHTSYYFSKFRQANPLRLPNAYICSATDLNAVSTTYIKDGKIIKTIYDYGLKSTPELIWAYKSMLSVQNYIMPDTMPSDKPYCPYFKYFTFKKGNLKLELEKSESFYLWTELNKAVVTNNKFVPKYSVVLIENLTYWGPDPNKNRKPQLKLKKITTDGQYYKFEFNDHEPITYNLGYNFIESNLSKREFIKPEEWTLDIVDIE